MQIYIYISPTLMIVSIVITCYKPMDPMVIFSHSPSHDGEKAWPSLLVFRRDSSGNRHRDGAMSTCGAAVTMN